MRIETEKTYNEKVNGDNVVIALVTIYGNSSDDKPTDGIANGSVFIETDTKKLYIYDESAEEWGEI